jgi:hypothetical protein
VAHNSTPERNLLANGFLAHNLGEELPAAPGSRIFVTKAVTDEQAVVTPEVAKLSGKARSDAIEKNRRRFRPSAKKTPATAAPCRPTTAAWSST